MRLGFYSFMLFNFIQITLADVATFTWLDQLTSSRYVVPGIFDRYPDLHVFYKNFWNNPLMKSYLETRPLTNT